MDTAQRPADVRSAIVTGGAGGIGRVTCRRLAEAGYVVVVADLDGGRAADVAAALPAAPGGKHVGFGGDLTSSDVNRDLAETASRIAPIGLLVNGIGISPKRGGGKIDLEDVDDELWTSVLSVNLTAPFYASRAVAPLMPGDGTASIVMLESVTSRMGVGARLDEFPPYLPSTIAYGVSKGGLSNLRVSLVRELARRSIRVNGVAPGFVATAMMSAADAGPLVDQLPTRRYARPEEVADAIAYLASPQAAYVNGACIDVNGGWLPA
ncbi:3-oxoacyl-[acyl-carrier protein] reductase [Actinomycetales bacterium JB111]|nr:3-oxoacyl-[acyl-carrier protein] reductase [Actinomycetales bacterium JB111]